MKNTELDIIVENLRKKGLSYSEIFQMMKEDTLESIPLAILQNRKIGALQSIVIYLKDEKKLKFNDIAKLLKRDDRTIWTTYKQGKKKLSFSGSQKSDEFLMTKKKLK